MLFPFRNMRVSHVTKRLCKRLTSVPSQEHDSIFQPTLLRPHVPPLRTSVTSIFPDELCLHLALSSDVVPEAESPRVAIPTPPPRDLQGPGRANAAPASPGRVPTGRRPFPCPCSTLPWAQIKRSCLTLQGCRVPPAPGACLPASPHRPAALRHAFRSDGDTRPPWKRAPQAGHAAVPLRPHLRPLVPLTGASLDLSRTLSSKVSTRKATSGNVSSSITVSTQETFLRTSYIWRNYQSSVLTPGLLKTRSSR